MFMAFSMFVSSSLGLVKSSFMVASKEIDHHEASKPGWHMGAAMGVFIGPRVLTARSVTEHH